LIEMLREHLQLLDAAIRINTASANTLCEQRTELFRLKRKTLEMIDEFTPVRPPSQSDVKAAFETSQQGPIVPPVPPRRGR
jgi:hypothetical protein